MRLRPLLKPVLNRVLPPVTKWYLRKPRRFSFLDLDLIVQPGVFHPGMYFSSKYLAEHVLRLDLEGKRVLEIGTGSGFLSLLAARGGAQVTATDISPLAVSNAEANATRNGIELVILQSDLFAALPSGRFDVVLINPPYYPGTPTSDEEHAWYCGPEWEYFQLLFSGLGDFLAADATVLMVVSEDVAVEEIRRIAAEKGWKMAEVDRSKRWGEWNYVFGFGRTKN